MATVDDAIRALTDPANASSFGRRGMRAVNRDRVIAAVRGLGASEREAEELALQALKDPQVRGAVVPVESPGGANSPPRKREDWYVAADAIRE